MTSQTFILTLDAYMTLFNQEGPFELIDGERIFVTPTNFWHTHLTHLFLFALREYGAAFAEAAFVLVDSHEWVRGSRIPDVMFINSQRLADYKASQPDWQEKPLLLVPDLVVEIVSPTDSYGDVERKVARYLDDGVKLVWVVEPRSQSIIVHRQNSKQATRLTIQDSLDGDNVIPAFSLSLVNLFSPD